MKIDGEQPPAIQFAAMLKIGPILVANGCPYYVTFFGNGPMFCSVRRQKLSTDLPKRVDTVVGASGGSAKATAARLCDK